MRKTTLAAFVLIALASVHSFSYAEEKKGPEAHHVGASVPAMFCPANAGSYTESPYFLAQEFDPCPGGLTCMTYFCGGTDRNPYVCCPPGFPYLNHCDCRCYDTTDFDCGSYSKCYRY